VEALVSAAHLLATVLTLWRVSASPALAERTRLVAVAAARSGVPASLLAAVCWCESRLGSAPLYASLCGVRLGHRYVRDDAASADIAARSLAGLVRRCGSPAAALAAYRVAGVCADPRGAAYATIVLSTAGRIVRAAGAGGGL
jgi:hypothetical protein